MKRLFIFIISMLLAGQVQAANLDAKLGLISDLHQSQIENNVVDSVVPMLTLVDQMEPGVINWLGLGDMIDSSAGDRGPYALNDADIQAPFLASGRTIKAVTGNHDTSGGYPAPPLFPGPYWSWDIGSKWRVLAMEAADQPGEAFSAAKLSWLEGQVAQAVTDGKYVIMATHFQVGTTRTPPTKVLTASGTTGTVTVTSNTAGAFSTGVISQRLYLRHGSCADASCWGWGTMTGCDGGAACTTGTTATVSVVQPFLSTNPADDWAFLGTQDQAANSPAVRAILETGVATVKLGLSGHTHRTGAWTVNGVEYVNITSARNTGGAYGISRSGGILYLYDDGTWKLRGTGMQPSYNWSEFYYDPVDGDDELNGGTATYDAWKTWAKITEKLVPGVMAQLKADLTANINLNGESGAPISIKSSDGGRYKINGSIAGSYLEVENIDLSAGMVFSASNCTAKGVRITP
jgi:3',5'-cyclic AMP phosphodiesterase CpdA